MKWPRGHMATPTSLSLGLEIAISIKKTRLCFRYCSKIHLLRIRSTFYRKTFEIVLQNKLSMFIYLQSNCDHKNSINTLIHDDPLKSVQR